MLLLAGNTRGDTGVFNLLSFSDDSCHQLVSADFCFFPGRDVPKFDHSLLQFRLSDDDRQRDPVVLAVLELVQHLGVLFVRLLSLKKKQNLQ